MSAPGSFIDARLALKEDSKYCPVRATLALLGQKWVPRIIYELMQDKRRFNDLASVIGGCNSRTLRDRLTPRERKLGLTLRKLEDWGRAYMAEPAVNA